MTDTRPTTLLIDLGDLPSLTAAVTQTDPARLVLWHLQLRGAAADQRLKAARSHVELLGTTELIVERCWTLPDEVEVLSDAAMLLQASVEALRLGLGRIIWPVVRGEDANAVGLAVEQAIIISELIDLNQRESLENSSAAAFIIELPLVDLEDEQVVDLADDCGAPLSACWPCDENEREPCGVCAGCHRWRSAFHAADRAWPWALAGVG